MKRLLLASLLAGFAFAASAQSTVGVATQPTTQPDSAHANATARDVRDHTCLSHTGSLITTAQNRNAVRRARDQHAATVDVKCADFGRAYTRDDIERTGAIDLADALRRLDPAVH